MTTQLLLPGQAHVADGPHDQTGMYLMHHAFRRDLRQFVDATANTPIQDRQVWRALADRWSRFGAILHHHHTLEDTWIWPVLLNHAAESGNVDDLATLQAMQAEHEKIDPALAACDRGFATMVARPREDDRRGLHLRLTNLAEGLDAHLRHEESEALPVLQRTMTSAEFEASEKAAKKGYPPKVAVFMIGWVVDGLPDEARARLFKLSGPLYSAIYRLVRRRYERLTATAFRHA